MSSDRYKLMIYFAHSTMVMYEASIVSHEKMSFGKFYDVNKAVIERVVEEGINIFNYELSHEQIGKAISVYMNSKYFPQNVEESVAYTIS